MLPMEHLRRTRTGLFPRFNQVGSAVIINAFPTSGASVAESNSLMLHETGHTLGLHHTDVHNNNTASPGCDGNIVSPSVGVCGGLRGDNNSIMQSEHIGITTLSNYDRRAIGSLYPSNTPPNYSISLNSYDLNWGKLWMKISGSGWNNVVISRNGNVKYDGCGYWPDGQHIFGDFDNGSSPYTYDITVTNFMGDLTATKSVQVYW
jgi:hypothetical protein